MSVVNRLHLHKALGYNPGEKKKFSKAIPPSAFFTNRTLHICLFCSIEQANVHAYTITLCYKRIIQYNQGLLPFKPIISYKKYQITQLIVKIIRLIHYEKNNLQKRLSDFFHTKIVLV